MLLPCNTPSRQCKPRSFSSEKIKRCIKITTRGRPRRRFSSFCPRFPMGEHSTLMAPASSPTPCSTPSPKPTSEGKLLPLTTWDDELTLAGRHPMGRKTYQSVPPGSRQLSLAGVPVCPRNRLQGHWTPIRPGFTEGATSNAAISPNCIHNAASPRGMAALASTLSTPSTTPARSCVFSQRGHASPQHSRAQRYDFVSSLHTHNGMLYIPSSAKFPIQRI